MVHVVKKKRCSTVLKQELKLLKMSTSIFSFQFRLETFQWRKDKSEGTRCKLLQLYINIAFNIFNVYLCLTVRLCLDYVFSTLHKCENKLRQPRKVRVANGWTSEMSMLSRKFQRLLKSPFWLARKGVGGGGGAGGSMGWTVSRQTASNLNVKRRNMLFFTVNRQKRRLTLTRQKVSQNSENKPLHV